MNVRRLCKLCGEEHVRLISRVNYGPFVDWELYHCPNILADEIGHDDVHRILYFGDDNVYLSENAPHRG